MRFCQIAMNQYFMKLSHDIRHVQFFFMSQANGLPCSAFFVQQRTDALS